MPRNLCLFTDSLEPSGVGEHMLTLAAALHRQYTIFFICPPSPAGLPFLDRAARLGIKPVPLNAPFGDSAALDALCTWLRGHAIDIFHCHAGIGWEGLGGIAAARAAGVPVVVRTEHLPYLITHPIQQIDHARAAAAVDRLLGVSEAVAASYIAAGAPAAKVCWVHNGIYPRPVALDRATARRRAGLPPGGPVVLTIGRFSEQKGHRYLLEAIPAVVAQASDACFAWAGSGELEDDLRARATAAGLTDHLCFLGRREDVPTLLAAADLFVLPSLFEGLPLVMLEAMAAGLPVVGTRVCGTAEAVADGVTGRLVDPQSGAALAAGILEVLAQPDRGARWGAAGRRRVAAHFHADHMAAATAHIYEELLTTYRPSRPTVDYYPALS